MDKERGSEFATSAGRSTVRVPSATPPMIAFAFPWHRRERLVRRPFDRDVRAGETSMRAVRLARANGRTEAQCRLDSLVLDLSPAW
jgi:hypothetical protein